MEHKCWRQWSINLKKLHYQQKQRAGDGNRNRMTSFVDAQLKWFFREFCGR
jgi:hypothetical protein